jgi:hypothetical protein
VLKHHQRFFQMPGVLQQIFPDVSSEDGLVRIVL